MVIIDFFLQFVFIMIFITIISVLLFLIVERLFDKSPTNFQDKIRLLFKRPKNLDDETRKLFHHSMHYFTGCIFLAVSIQYFIHLYFDRSSVHNAKRLVFPIFILLFGILEILDEHFYKVSKIDCSYHEKYGWKSVLKASYHKELMKNSPITLMSNIFLLVPLISLILLITLALFLFMLNKFYP